MTSISSPRPGAYRTDDQRTVGAPYKALLRDRFAIWLANQVLHLLASRRCVEMLDGVYRRGLASAPASRPTSRASWFADCPLCAAGDESHQACIPGPRKHDWLLPEMVGAADALVECRRCGTYLGSAASERPCS